MTIDVVASSASPVLDAPFHLVFDATRLAFVDATAGDFLASGGGHVVFLANGASRPGDVTVGVARADRARGVRGTGVLARIVLRGVAPGMAAIGLERALAWDAWGRQLAVVTTGSRVFVGSGARP